MSFENILDLLYDMCRLCLERTGRHNLFTDPSYIDEIAECAGVQVLPYEQLPQTICDVCVERLRVCKSFRGLVSRSDERLRQLLRGGAEVDSDAECELMTPSIVMHSPEHTATSVAPEVTSQQCIAGSDHNIEEDAGGPRIRVRVDIFGGTDDKGTTSKGEKSVTVETEKMKEQAAERTSVTSEYFAETHAAPVKIKKRKKLPQGTEEHSAATNEGQDEPATRRESFEMKKPKIESLVCEICNKECATPKALYHHRRGHIKNHVCPLCSKGFSCKNDLTKHIRVHTGEKPFQCTICDRGFTQSGTLKMHMESHETKRFLTALDTDYTWSPWINEENLKTIKKLKYTHTMNVQKGHRNKLKKHTSSHVEHLEPNSNTMKDETTNDAETINDMLSSHNNNVSDVNVIPADLNEINLRTGDASEISILDSIQRKTNTVDIKEVSMDIVEMDVHQALAEIKEVNTEINTDVENSENLHENNLSEVGEQQIKSSKISKVNINKPFKIKIGKPRLKRNRRKIHKNHEEVEVNKDESDTAEQCGDTGEKHQSHKLQSVEADECILKDRAIENMDSCHSDINIMHVNDNYNDKHSSEQETVHSERNADECSNEHDNVVAMDMEPIFKKDRICLSQKESVKVAENNKRTSMKLDKFNNSCKDSNSIVSRKNLLENYKDVCNTVGNANESKTPHNAIKRSRKRSPKKKKTNTSIINESKNDSFNEFNSVGHENNVNLDKDVMLEKNYDSDTEKQPCNISQDIDGTHSPIAKKPVQHVNRCADDTIEDSMDNENETSFSTTLDVTYNTTTKKKLKQSKQRKVYSCKFCSETFKQREKYAAHVRNHRKIIRFC